MIGPRKTSAAPYANVTNDLSILFGEVWPKSEEEVGGFLADAAFALGGREADLARVLGVSRATLSGWKTRGVIPAVHARWFVDEFAFAVVTVSNPALSADFRHAGIPAVFHLLRATDFDPFRLGDINAEEAINLSYWYFGGMCRLALFIERRLPIDPNLPVSQFEARIGSVLGHVVQSLAPRLRNIGGVSQSVSQ